MRDDSVAGVAAPALDAADPLAALRARFRLPPSPDGTPAVYLCSHSLGLQPVDAAAHVNQVLDQWAALGVHGHTAGAAPWLPYHTQFAAPLARLTGAGPDEVVAMNTLTVNLHVLLTSFYRPDGQRHRILIEKSAFPSDRYAVVSQLALHGHADPDALIEVAPAAGTDLLDTAAIIEAIERAGSSLALVLLPGVQYLTGQVLDIAEISRAAHRVGAVIGWDLAHAVGNIPLSLHDANVDFAAWCSYKYLCGGPGAVGGAFVHARHGQNPGIPRLAGWWGHDAATRFLMGPDFVPMPGAEGWQLSNPPILSLAPLIAALAAFDAAGIDRLRAKSLALTGFARARIEARCGDALSIVTPAATGEHGAQLSLRLRAGAGRGRAIHARLSAAGIVCDWREPDIIRLAPAPLYNSFTDVDRAVARLAAAIDEP